MRNAVVFPHPDGPTITINSPSAIARSRSKTALVPSSKTFETLSNSIVASVKPPTFRSELTRFGARPA
jgi:hypothetical protein